MRRITVYFATLVPLFPACSLLLDFEGEPLLENDATAGHTGKDSTDKFSSAGVSRTGNGATSLVAQQTAEGTLSQTATSQNGTDTVGLGVGAAHSVANTATPTTRSGGSENTAGFSSVETRGTGGSTSQSNTRNDNGLNNGGTEAASTASGGALLEGGTAPGGSGPMTSTPASEEKPFVKSVALGGSHACALYSTGSVKCWGWNSHGELGDGGVLPSARPVEVIGLTRAKQLSAGLQFSCALLDDDTVSCWGNNGCGELGTGDTVDSHVPVEVSGLKRVVSISAGYGVTCAVTQGGGLYCWGCNDFGSLGNGSLGGGTGTPIRVAGSETYIGVSATYQVCGVSSIYDLLCWGFNSAGEVGDGATEDRSSPFKVGIAGSVATGFGHTCAIGITQKVNCWGANDYGQLGNGTMNPSTTAAQVSGVAGATMIDASSGSTCALVGTEVKCWGHGPLGDGTTESSPVPVTVNLGPASSIGVGTGFACAVLADTSVYCWGANNYGQLGDGTTQDRLYPVKVIGL